MTDRILTDVFAYPLKAGRAVALADAFAYARGLRRDRRWLLATAAGDPVMLKSHPRLAVAEIGLDGDVLTAAAPGLPPLRVAPPPADAPAIGVKVKRRELAARRAPAEADAWFARLLGEPISLAHLPPDDAPADADPAVSAGLAGCAPYLICCEASLADLDARLAARGEPPAAMARFRANLVVVGGAPYEEDGWKRLRIGEAEFEVLRPCPRCPNITVDPETGAEGPEPLRTLAAYRAGDGGAMFGVFARVVREGALRPGDPVVPAATP